MKKAYGLVALVIFAFRIPLSFAADSPPGIEWVTLAVEPAINDAIEKGKEDVRRANLADPNKKVVGPLTGTDWLQLTTASRTWHIRGIADTYYLLTDISFVTGRNLDTEARAKSLERDTSLAQQPSYTVGWEMQSTFISRLGRIIAGRPFGDTSAAVTKYYENNPLFRERPVLWVLTVPLLKELKAAAPKGSTEEVLWELEESITVPLRKPRTTQPTKGKGSTKPVGGK